MEMERLAVRINATIQYLASKFGTRRLSILSVQFLSVVEITISIIRQQSRAVCTVMADVFSVVIASSTICVKRTAGSRITVVSGWLNPIRTRARRSDVRLVLVADPIVRVAWAVSEVTENTGSNSRACTGISNYLYFVITSTIVRVVMARVRITLVSGWPNPIGTWARRSNVRPVLVALLKVRVAWARSKVAVIAWHNSIA